MIYRSQKPEFQRATGHLSFEMSCSFDCFEPREAEISVAIGVPVKFSASGIHVIERASLLVLVCRRGN